LRDFKVYSISANHFFFPFFFFFLAILKNGFESICDLGNSIPSLNYLSNSAQLHYFSSGWMIAFLKLSNGVNSLYLANFSFNLWISYKYYDLWSRRLLSSRTAENGFRVDVTSMTSVFALLRSNTDMLCSALIVSLMIGSLCKYEPYYLRVSFSLALFIVCSTRMMPNEPYCRAYCLAFVTLVNVLIDWIFLESSDLNRHLLPAHWVMKPALI